MHTSHDPIRPHWALGCGGRSLLVTAGWEGAYEKALLLTGGVGGGVKERMNVQASSLNGGISSKNK